jgi:hypothetical protein
VSRYGPIEHIASDHRTEHFDCRSDAQTTWLKRHALQAHQSDAAKVYVVCRGETRDVVGYFALAAGSVGHDAATPRVTKGIGQYPVPVVILARLGVDRSEQGEGVGSALVRDALLQTASIAERVGVRALLIHAETPEAAAFYRHIAPGFETSPTDPLHLIVLMKVLRAAIREAASARAALRGERGAVPSSDEARRQTREEEAEGPSRGARAVQRLRESGGRVRMTTDEIMDLTRGD